MDEPLPRQFRAFARRPLNLPARLSGLGGQRWEGRLVDIGLGGACVEIPAPPGPGSAVTLHINTPSLWEPLVLDASIVWVVGAEGRPVARAGLRFEHGRSTIRPLRELIGAGRYD